MRDGGRIAAALAVLEDFGQRRVPLKVALADWARGARYAGAKDRAFISGLCLDALRRWRSFGGEDSPRQAVRLTLEHGWGWPEERVAAAFAEEPHGPGALTDAERDAVPGEAIDVPEWLLPEWERVSDAAVEAAALAARAPVDLRVNLLKGSAKQALKATRAIGAEPAPLVRQALRIAPPPGATRAPAVDIIPAYGRGLVDIQDEGSQIAALCAGEITGAQVLDLCAGGGGKSLAMAAAMGNSGQIFAYDADPRRLAPIHERLRRAGARNVQVKSPAASDSLRDLQGRMDVVLVDAPCTGTGTWRRRPDSKWRLTAAQWQARLAEQDAVLGEAARYVAPGGALVYVTCSVLPSENEDRVQAFLEQHDGFTKESALSALPKVWLTEEGRALLARNEADGTLRLSPKRSGTDGFAITRLCRTG